MAVRCDVVTAEKGQRTWRTTPKWTRCSTCDWRSMQGQISDALGLVPLPYPNPSPTYVCGVFRWDSRRPRARLRAW
eukprot:2480463-Prymnesium_polylepis.1